VGELAPVAQKEMNTSKCSFHTGDIEFLTVFVLNTFAPTNTDKQQMILYFSHWMLQISVN